MTTPEQLLNLLAAGCTSGSTAVRVFTRLAPAGAAADKVFGPTYNKDGESTYATEERRVGDATTPTVLLDSVQSQANRMEQALKTWWEADEERLPMLVVKLPRGDRHVEITALDAPHRAADAIFRDSTYEGVRFRDSAVGKRFVSARPDDAAPLFGICPTALLFGQWDSTAGAGTQGAKFQRAIVSEIVGYGAVAGKRTSSRLDPLQIEKDAVEIFKAESGYWTFDETRALKEKNKPVKTKPSEVNHGNVAPSISDVGGHSIQWAEQVTVLSFPALRRLRFPTEAGVRSLERDVAARAVLAALGLHALVLLQEDGYDLRSRCLLQVVDRRAEVLGATAADVTPVALTPELTGEVLRRAVNHARSQGLPWASGRIELKPSKDLETLVAKSLRANLE